MVKQMYVKCAKNTIGELKAVLGSSLALLEQYEWLINSYVLDFFVDDHWSKLPGEWQCFFDQAGPKDLAFLINLSSESDDHNQAWPLEILRLKAAVKELSLSRKFVPRQAIAKELGLHDTESDWQTDIQMILPKHVDCVFKKHIKPKKMHELLRMTDVALMLSEKTQTKSKVDVGGGVGHLSRFLAFCHDFSVTCIEAEEDFGLRASKFDQDLLKAVSSKGVAFKEPKHQTLKIDPDIESEKFVAELNCGSNFGLVGLHTCGDLGPTLLRLYAESPRVSHLQSVGCCYMFIKSTFPMSNYVKEALKPQLINYTSLELACHAIECYKEKLSNPDEVNKLRVHCRRALLEKLVVQQRPELRHSGLKTVKNSHLLEFSDYVVKATANLDVEFNLPELKSLGAEEDDNWWRVVCFYTLRLLFAPLIETVVLLDRCIYLHEEGLESSVVPIFESEISPRNFVIVSTK